MSTQNQLVIYFIGDGLYGATRKSDDALTRFGLPPELGKKLASQLKLASLPDNPGLTVFRDYSFADGSATKDLWFERTHDSTTPPSAPTKPKSKPPYAAWAGGLAALAVALIEARKRIQRRQP